MLQLVGGYSGELGHSLVALGKSPMSSPCIHTLSFSSACCSMRTGAHAQVLSSEAYEEILKTKFAGVPEAWIPLVAKQVTGDPLDRSDDFAAVSRSGSGSDVLECCRSRCFASNPLPPPAHRCPWCPPAQQGSASAVLSWGPLRGMSSC
jgi:hypothetical protein